MRPTPALFTVLLLYLSILRISAYDLLDTQCDNSLQCGRDVCTFVFGDYGFCDACEFIYNESDRSLWDCAVGWNSKRGTFMRVTGPNLKDLRKRS